MAKRITWTVIAGLFAFAIIGNWITDGSNTVALKAPYKSDIVQMFSRTRGDVTADDVTRLPDGMRCDVLRDARPYDIGDGGPPIVYYKLDCDGDIGYVSEMWVR